MKVATADTNRYFFGEQFSKPKTRPKLKRGRSANRKSPSPYLLDQGNLNQTHH